MSRWWIAAACLVAAVPVAAQPAARVNGQVRLASLGDTTGVAGAKVVLHQVGVATQGPLDSVRTDGGGRFGLSYIVDTTANYLLSTRFADIEYFSAPLSAEPGGTSTIQLLVFDTSSTAPTGTASRTLVVSAPDALGARTVVDWFTITNDGALTRVAADSTGHTWAAPLPAGVVNMGQGDARFSQISPDAVQFREDSVYVTAPLAPGEKSLLLQYELPASERLMTVSLASIDSVDVFLEERNVSAIDGEWAPADSQPFQGRMFYRYRRTAPGVASLALRFPGSGIPPGAALIALVGALVLGLTVASVLAVRRRPPVRRGAGRVGSAAALADRIAQLDVELSAVAAEAGTPERARLAAERDRLMAELRAALAARRGRS